MARIDLRRRKKANFWNTISFFLQIPRITFSFSTLKLFEGKKQNENWIIKFLTINSIDWQLLVFFAKFKLTTCTNHFFSVKEVKNERIIKTVKILLKYDHPRGHPRIGSFRLTKFMKSHPCVQKHWTYSLKISIISRLDHPRRSSRFKYSV